MPTADERRRRFLLRNLDVTRVDLVDRGANQYADILIAKADGKPHVDDKKRMKVAERMAVRFDPELEEEQDGKKRKRKKGKAAPILARGDEPLMKRVRADAEAGRVWPLLKHAEHNQQDHDPTKGKGKGSGDAPGSKAIGPNYKSKDQKYRIKDSDGNYLGRQNVSSPYLRFVPAPYAYPFDKAEAKELLEIFGGEIEEIKGNDMRNKLQKAFDDEKDKKRRLADPAPAEKDADVPGTQAASEGLTGPAGGAKPDDPAASPMGEPKTGDPKLGLEDTQPGSEGEPGEQAGDKGQKLKQWLNQVDQILNANSGVSIKELSAIPWIDLFEQGLEPGLAVKEALVGASPEPPRPELDPELGAVAEQMAGKGPAGPPGPFGGPGRMPAEMAPPGLLGKPQVPTDGPVPTPGPQERMMGEEEAPPPKEEAPKSENPFGQKSPAPEPKKRREETRGRVRERFGSGR